MAMGCALRGRAALPERIDSMQVVFFEACSAERSVNDERSRRLEAILEQHAEETK